MKNFVRHSLETHLYIFVLEKKEDFASQKKSKIIFLFDSKILFLCLIDVKKVYNCITLVLSKYFNIIIISAIIIYN